MPFNRETIRNRGVCLSDSPQSSPSRQSCVDGLIIQLRVRLKCIYIHVKRVSYD